MFAEIFQRRDSEVKECGLKTVNEVRASNFLAGGRGRISSYASGQEAELVLEGLKKFQWVHTAQAPLISSSMC